MTLDEWQLRLCEWILNVKGLNYLWKVQAKRVNLITSSYTDTSLREEIPALWCSSNWVPLWTKKRCWWALSFPLWVTLRGQRVSCECWWFCHKLCTCNNIQPLGCRGKRLENYLEKPKSSLQKLWHLSSCLAPCVSFAFTCLTWRGSPIIHPAPFSMIWCQSKRQWLPAVAALSMLPLGG